MAAYVQLSEKISAGDLSQTIRVDANNELADLSTVINEMASNLQEIILLAQRMCAGGNRFVEADHFAIESGYGVGIHLIYNSY